MPLKTTYIEAAPTPEDVAAMRGPVVLEFGTNWCGFCQAAQPLIAQAFDRYSHVEHFKVEDGPGRRLGRSFRVKLWPTLIFLYDGKEVARTVRPVDASDVEDGFASLPHPQVVQVERAAAEKAIPADPDPDDPASP
ncbi:thioredoxin [Oxalobacteraceae bacterium OM1]|nr:thioredoxin [Oxalobacteraceae bacterium OM1]